MLAVIRRWIIITLILAIAGFLLYHGYQYRLARDLLPAGTSVADLDVSGLKIDEARDLVSKRYSAPVYLYHQDDHVELDPQNVGFILDLDAMFGQLERALAEREEWLSFANFVLQRPIKPISIPLAATHDRGAFVAMLESIAELLDNPSRAPQMLAQEQAIKEGEPGQITNVEDSLEASEAALYRLDNRVAQLDVVRQEAPELSFDLLEEVIDSKLQTFNGMGSIFIKDLQNGEEININADVAMSGLSILKIGIFVEAFRAMDGPPNTYQQGILLDTAIRSSNFGANLLLHEVAGENNTYRGADIFTESMHQLGLVNTFMAVPYDASPPAYRQTTYSTPANLRTDITTQPDSTMQSTAEDIGALLAMIYYCSKGGGTLLAVYPDDITPKECQEIIDLMVLNEEGNLIRYGVPDGTPVSHKHGWALGTHADAGIVYTPGGDYIIVEYLNQPGEWLLADESFPILREIARAVYNYFNMADPYLGNPLADRGVIDTSDPFSEGLSTDDSVNEEGVDTGDEPDIETESVEEVTPADS
jgi:beta-lactamase class A